MNSCVPHRVIWGLLAFALCCIVDFGPCLLVCPGSSVGRALCLYCRVSWVRVPPRAALSSLSVESLGTLETIALLHLARMRAYHCRFASLPCLLSGSFLRLISISVGSFCLCQTFDMFDTCFAWLLGSI